MDSKKLLAREGLIVLGFIVAGVILHLSWTKILVPGIMQKAPFSFTRVPGNSAQNKPRYEFIFKNRNVKILLDGADLSDRQLCEMATFIAINERVIKPTLRWRLVALLYGTKDIAVPVFLIAGYFYFQSIRAIIWAVRRLGGKKK